MSANLENSAVAKGLAKPVFTPILKKGSAFLYGSPNYHTVQFSRSVVSNSATPWTAAHHASLSITNSRSLLKLMSTVSEMPSSHLILCCPLEQYEEA